VKCRREYQELENLGGKDNEIAERRKRGRQKLRLRRAKDGRYRGM